MKVKRLQAICEDERGDEYSIPVTFTDMRSLVDEHFRRLENLCPDKIDDVFGRNGACSISMVSV
jgi:hypothetical protein